MIRKIKHNNKDYFPNDKFVGVLGERSSIGQSGPYCINLGNACKPEFFKTDETEFDLRNKTNEKGFDSPEEAAFYRDLEHIKRCMNNGSKPEVNFPHFFKKDDEGNIVCLHPNDIRIFLKGVKIQGIFKWFRNNTWQCEDNFLYHLLINNKLNPAGFKDAVQIKKKKERDRKQNLKRTNLKET